MLLIMVLLRNLEAFAMPSSGPAEILGDYEYHFDECPDIKPIYLNKDKYRGIWYNVKRSRETGDTCPIYNYKRISINELLLTNDVIEEKTNKSEQYKYNITLKYSTYPSGTVLDLAEFDSGHNYYVLGTDYESYAIEFTCQVYHPNPAILYIWIQSRTNILSSKAEENVRDILTRNKLNTVPLQVAYDPKICKN